MAPVRREAPSRATRGRLRDGDMGFTSRAHETATRARPRQLVLYHQLFWGTDDAGLLAELRRAGYTASAVSARDLGIY